MGAEPHAISTSRQPILVRTVSSLLTPHSFSLSLSSHSSFQIALGVSIHSAEDVTCYVARTESSVKRTEYILFCQI